MRRWILTVMLITLSPRLLAYKVPYEAWMGTYVGDAKVGYLTYRIDRADVNGVEGYKISSIMSNRLTLLGSDVSQLITTVVFTDADYSPLREHLEMSSGGRTMSVSAEFTKDKIECVLSTVEGKSHKTIPIPQGAKLVGDATFGVADPTRKVGSHYKVHYFNPLTLSVDELNVTITGRGHLTIDGKDYNTLTVRSSSPMGDVTIWQNDSGDVLKVTAMAGIMMIWEDKDKALSGIKGATEDFAIRTSVKVDKPIANPRQVKSLDIVLEGIDDPTMIISDSRQKAESDQSGTVRYRITVKTFPKKRSASLPINKPGLSDYLGTSPYLDYDLGGVREKAKQIVGGEKNALAICSKIRAWLHENMRTRTDVGISRPASDVLKSREGVCRDHAILFAAMARAMGVPSKVAAGLIFTNGAFYYHAWVECWVGEWVPFDGTMPTDFVDATHIKLAEGSATSMFGLARVIGSLKAEVRAVK